MGRGNTNYLLFRKVVGEINHEAACLPVSGDKVTIRIIADKLEYKFYRVVDGAAVYLGRAEALFSRFSYQGFDRELP